MVITTIGPVSFASPSNSIRPHTTTQTKSNKTNLSEPFTKTYKCTRVRSAGNPKQPIINNPNHTTFRLYTN